MIHTTCPAALIIICLTGLVPGSQLSVQQTPERINTTEGSNVSITCHIEVESRAERLIVLWLKNNGSKMDHEIFYVSKNRFSTCSTGYVCINATFHLPAIYLNHSGFYYCKIWTDLPILFEAYGKGSHVYVGTSQTCVETFSTLVTMPGPPLTMGPANHYENTVMWLLLSWCAILLLVISIACVIHIYNKGHCRSELRAKEASVDAFSGSQCPVPSETIVVYAALNIPKSPNSAKTRNEDCAALAPSTGTCTEDSVTYSEVHIKKGPKDEG
ncbi:uncharacterized protein LOC127424153 [Myxocyprinus asiaticus]|uniref:uncharacterized protein LOC127424153 n=1 Tax=Myxocyprinus asiaticus TaxID=70543 RepID=UPI0022235179|nr:uncharacterized protein LOC127424153 [Myxocyprinus asiaticus]